MKKLNLKSELILNKKFSTELSGYNAKEVDQYLDEILSDYRVYEEKVRVQRLSINEKNELLSDRDEEIERMTLEIETLKSQLSKAEEASSGSLKQEIEELKRQFSKIK
ncbi:DivIVA domain-containing protein [Mycoplasma marinum]|uniref:DivIVA domain-containing protein n=1 Tax=Mycoplasma marinum TaxID=1937190 RepID=A0A4R0XMQ9_9MOLU|nr:DivIVA domain-containing protein [Mycoplasma marinum]TCG12001.1 hypothetical protein C4B24_00100 [Mycoplasma marinum]